MDIKGTVVGDKELVTRFDKMTERLRVELRKGIGRAALLVQRRVKQDKLSGQVLKVRTGRLRRSINVGNITESAAEVTGTVGTNVSYARAHEYGFDGNVTVHEHLRRAKSGSRFNVRAHTRHVVIPEKSFLRSALAELEQPIRHELESAIKESLIAGGIRG